MTSKSSFIPEELERRISRGYCRGIGPRSSLSIYILGMWPKLRTSGCPRRRKVHRKDKYMEKQNVKVCEDLQKEGKYPRIGFLYLRGHE